MNESLDVVHRVHARIDRLESHQDERFNRLEAKLDVVSSAAQVQHTDLAVRVARLESERTTLRWVLGLAGTGGGAGILALVVKFIGG